MVRYEVEIPRYTAHGWQIKFDALIDPELPFRHVGFDLGYIARSGKLRLTAWHDEFPIVGMVRRYVDDVINSTTAFSIPEAVETTVGPNNGSDPDRFYVYTRWFFVEESDPAHTVLAHLDPSLRNDFRRRYPGYAHQSMTQIFHITEA